MSDNAGCVKPMSDKKLSTRDVLVLGAFVGVIVAIAWMTLSLEELRTRPATVCSTVEADNEVVRVRGDLLSCRTELEHALEKCGDESREE